jgi:hypothetical protein
MFTDQCREVWALTALQAAVCAATKAVGPQDPALGVSCSMVAS